MVSRRADVVKAGLAGARCVAVRRTSLPGVGGTGCAVGRRGLP